MTDKTVGSMTTNTVLRLSRRAGALWGKSDRNENDEWLPLFMHMSDSAFVADKLWDCWVPKGTRFIVEQALGNDAALSRTLYRFLAGIHDIGKAVPVFQCKQWLAENGQWNDLIFLLDQVDLQFSDGVKIQTKPTHPVAGQAILAEYFKKKYRWSEEQSRSYFCVVGGHHGQPPKSGDLDSAHSASGSMMGWRPQDGNAWKDAQNGLIDFVRLLTGLDDAAVATLAGYRLQPLPAMVLTGLVIMADWIASNQQVFPLINMFSGEQRFLGHDGVVDIEALRLRAEEGWLRTGMIPAWHDSTEGDALHCSTQELYRHRFNFPIGASARPMQREAVEIAKNVSHPGIMVIEAPMGEGKTEAALAAAEVFAEKSGRGGVCVALPTMATTDAMFGRVLDWVNALPQDNLASTGAENSEKSVYLAHGKARLNEQFEGLVDDSFRQKFADVGVDVADAKNGTESAVVSEWMTGKKKGVLANFLVCTIDQLLMSALDMKHLALRQLGMVNKVVIVDECHAYDTYMRQYLLRVLEWLGAAGTPVILLSATLPERQRDEMVSAYMSGAGLSRSRVEAQPTMPGFKNHAKSRQTGKGREADASSVGRGPIHKETGKGIDESSGQGVDTAYPLITYTDGHDVHHEETKPSGRHTSVDVTLIDDGDEALVDALRVDLADGGCAGVVCDTVGRAQAVKQLLSEVFGKDCVVFLTHSRFMDLDRMDNEQYLRDVLGPHATRENGQRPQRMIVVGTQVLEQSLDIDFDLLVTDVAPVDLLMQRLGRVHRHHRGDSECDRPLGLRQAKCYVRGIEDWQEDGPWFASGVDRVYSAASLMESLAMLKLTGQNKHCMVSLPDDIPTVVRTAYSDGVVGHLPTTWTERYQDAVCKRNVEDERKQHRASTHRLRSLAELQEHGDSLVDLFSPANAVNETNELRDGSKFHLDDDMGPRAVRDTQESVEVLLLCKDDDTVRLLPWIGDEDSHIELGAEVPIDGVPEDALSQLVAQCAVRLPLALCAPSRIDQLIEELEESCADEVMPWQDSKWLAGRLVLFLERGKDNGFETPLMGYLLRYTRGNGLEYTKEDAHNDDAVNRF